MYKSPQCFLPSFKSTGLSVQEKKQTIDFQDSSHLGFLIGTILTILMYKSPLCLLWSFKSNGLSIQEKKRKIDLQDGHHGGHLGFQTGTFLAIFDLLVTLMLLTKFHLAFGSGEAKKRFSRCHSGHLGFPIGTILASFDLQVTPMLPTKFQVNWPYGSGEESKNRL